MWPWAHAAVGYLAFVAHRRAGGRPVRNEAAVLVVTGAAVLPDVIDKPLTWYAGVLPYGRTLGHSVLTGGTLVVLVVIVARRLDRPVLGRAFAIGYLSHLAADGLWAVLAGEWQELRYLAWPLVPPPTTEVQGLLAHLLSLEATPLILTEVALTGIALLVWRRDGYPGPGALRPSGWGRPQEAD